MSAPISSSVAEDARQQALPPPLMTASTHHPAAYSGALGDRLGMEIEHIKFMCSVVDLSKGG
jgi:hypothetical protein